MDTGLFSSKRWKKKLLSFKDNLGIEVPDSDHEEFLENDILKNLDSATKLFRLANLINEEDTISHLKFETIGEEHGFTGTIRRITSYSILQRDGMETKINEPKLVIKTCNADWAGDSDCEAKFLARIGPLYKRPCIPKLYLSLSDPGETNFYVLVMENISWGRTEDVDNGLDIERLAKVIDGLAEFHAY